MKKIFTVFLAVFLIFGLVGCDFFGTSQTEDRFEKIVREFEASVDKIPHYYAKLTQTEKAAYASIVTTINSLGDVAPVPDIDTASLQAVTRAVSYDNPQYLWLSKKWTVTHYASGANIEIPYLMPLAQRQEMVDELEKKVEQILRGVNVAMSDYDKELYFHDYIVKNCKYDYSALSDEEFNNSYTAYGALVEGTAVCEGYARAMQFLLSKVGIDSYLIPGTALNSYGTTVNHMWNVVKIDSEWYHLDTTWDDPSSGSDFNAVWHSYFNLSDEEIRRDHNYEEETNCTATKANYHKKNSLCFYSFNASDLADRLADELYKAKRMNENFIEIRFSNQSDFATAKQALMGKNLIYTAVNRANNRYGTKISASFIYCSSIDTQFVVGIKF